MAIYTVTTTSDTPVGSQLALRQALADAASNPGGDTIRFDLAATEGSTITLVGGELTIASDITIDGGSGVTVSAGGNSGIAITGGGTQVALDHLAIVDGLSERNGGGIYAGAGTDLALSYVTVANNDCGDGFGGGICSLGRLTTSNVAVSDNARFGGGIYAQTAVIEATTVSGNNGPASPGAGGGIAVVGSLELMNSTIVGNHAEFGGGICGHWAALDHDR